MRAAVGLALAVLLFRAANVWALMPAEGTAYLVCSMAGSNPANASSGSLAQLLSNQAVTTILLTEDCRLNPAEYSSSSTPRIRIERNVTIASAGQQMQLLEFSFIQNAALVPDGVIVTFRHLALGRSRKTSGWALPFFYGGGKLVLQDSVRIRWACQGNQTAITLASMRNIPRPAAIPGNQTVGIVTFTWRGVAYPDSFYMSDLALFVGPADSEYTQAYSGYFIHQLNTSRVCLSYISPDCQQTMSSDDCLAAATDAFLRAESAAAAGRGGSSAGPATSPAVVVAVSVVLAVCLAVAAAAVLVVWHQMRRRRQRLLSKQQQQQGQQPPDDDLESGQLLGSPSPTAAAAAAAAAGYTAGGVLDAAAACSSGSHAAAAAGACSAFDRWPRIFSGVACSLQDMALGSGAAGDGGDKQSGWQLMASHTSPDFKDASPQDKLALGVLLGVGSFGRVYKGRWRGRDVAVKVLHHDATTAASVANEVDLVMSFRHPNITQAFHFLTWSHSAAPEGSGNGGNNAGSSSSSSSSSSLKQLQQGAAAAAAPATAPAAAEGVALPQQQYVPVTSGSLVSLQNQQHRLAPLLAAVSPVDEVQLEMPTFVPCSPTTFRQQQQQQSTKQQEQQSTKQQEQQSMQQQQQQQQLARQPHQRQAVVTDSASSPVITLAQQTPATASVQQQQQQQGSHAKGSAVGGCGAAAGSRNGSGWGSSSGLSRGRLGAGGGHHPMVEAQTWLLLEFCDGGTLLDFILQEGRLRSRATGSVNLAHVLTLLSDTAAGMAYLHARNVLHGDLKPGNVMLKLQQGAPYGHTAKVTDFGMSRSLNVGQSHRSTRTIGTVSYMAPELLRLGRLSAACDIYSFGIMMWELFTGRIAFKGQHYGQVLEQVALLQERPPVPPDMPPEYAALMVAAWHPDPFSRPSFDIIQARLKAMLESIVQEQEDAQERFIADL